MRRIGPAVPSHWLLLSSALFFLFPSFPCRAEVFHDGEVIPPGAFKLGFEGQENFLLDKGYSNFVGLGHAGVGLGENLEGQAKVSILDNQQTYFGAELQYMLIANGDGYPAVSLNGGGHWIAPTSGAGTPGLDGTVTIHEDVFQQIIYGGYDLDLDWPPALNHASAHQHLFLGVKLVVSEHLAFYVEGGYGIPNADQPTPHYISGGPMFVFGNP